MSNFKITENWVDAEDKDILLKTSAAELFICAAEKALTQNINAWTKKQQDFVVVSTYPLAMWFAYSWWRLNYEPLFIDSGNGPNFSWRSSHELGSANHGFVWPQILFASDGESMNIWALPTDDSEQSAKYINGLNYSVSVPIMDFQKEVSNFILRTIDRISSAQPENDLAGLWNLVQEDRNDPGAYCIRKIEAAMGYDPEECPEELISIILDFQKSVGISSISELAPILGHDQETVQTLKGLKGIYGKPQVSAITDLSKSDPPWKQGVFAARKIRKQYDLGEGPLKDSDICDFLGISKQEMKSIGSTELSRLPLAVAKTEDSGGFFYSLRESRITAKRFQLARFLGDILTQFSPSRDWLVSTGCDTVRQKRQRSFAAEFLCPIESLVYFLGHNFSEPRLEDAAHHFNVSPWTIYSLLRNNNRLARPEICFPYSIGSSGTPLA